jgi:hypothetical protein
MGRLIRHASRGVTFAVYPLPVPMIEPAFRTALVAAVGRTALLAAGVRAADRAAIALPSIAVRTNPEHRLASLTAANPLPENHFFLSRRPPTRAGFDNDNGSCQGRTSFDGGLLMKVAQVRTPLLRTAGFSPAFPSHNTSFCWNVLEWTIDG